MRRLAQIAALALEGRGTVHPLTRPSCRSQFGLGFCGFEPPGRQREIHAPALAAKTERLLQNLHGCFANSRLSQVRVDVACRHRRLLASNDKSKVHPHAPRGAARRVVQGFASHCNRPATNAVASTRYFGSFGFANTSPDWAIKYPPRSFARRRTVSVSCASNFIPYLAM